MRTSLIIILTLISISCRGEISNGNAYDFTSERVIKKLGFFQMKVEKNKIIFDAKHGNVNDDILYDLKKDNFNFDGIYKIEGEDNSFYFRYGWQEFKNEQSIFSNVKWINNEKPASGEYQIHVVQIDFNQTGQLSLCTIGDSQTWWSYASKLRLFIKELECNYKFVGNRTDIYGYPHEGEGGNSSKQLFDRRERIPEADYYTILIGTNDWKNDIEETLANITKTVLFLYDKYPMSQILFLTPLPTTNKERDQFNDLLKHKLIEKLRVLEDRVSIVYLGEKMRKNKNWHTEYIGYDGLHQTEAGVKFMAEVIVDQLKNDKE